MMKMPGRRKSGAKKRVMRKSKARGLYEVRIPRYKLPPTRRMLQRDAAIAQLLLKLPGAPLRSQIIKEYRMTPGEFDKRAGYLWPIARALEKRMVIDTLLEMGRETAMKKGANLD